MAEPRSGFATLVARAMEADARYYEALGRLTSTWLRELAEVAAAVRLPQLTALRTPISTTVAPASPATSRPATAPVTEPVAGPAAEPHAAALVLEAAGGEKATGAFLVENTLAQRVEHAVEAGPLTGPAGETDIELSLVPDAVGLDPGEQVVVRVITVVPPGLAGEHRGTVRVAAVPGAEMPVVVRRTET